MELTIGKKLLGGFLFVLILLVIESAISNSLISSTEESYKRLIDENIENVLLANGLEDDHLKQSGAVKNYLLTGDTIYLSQYEAYAQKAHKTIDQMLKTYETAKDQEVIQQFAAFQLRYEELVNKAMTFKKEGNEVGYNNLLSTSSKTITNVFQGKIEALVKGQEELVRQGSEEVSSFVEKTKETVIYLAIMIFLIGTALAIIISRSISRPLHLLAQYTEKVITPKGKFNLEFPK